MPDSPTEARDDPYEEFGRWTIQAKETENGYMNVVLGDPLAEGDECEVIEVGALAVAEALQAEVERLRGKLEQLSAWGLLHLPHDKAQVHARKITAALSPQPEERSK